MAHFAKLGINGKVMTVHVVSDNDCLNTITGKEDEKVGQEFLEKIHGWPRPLWIQTSYNTAGGVHRLDGTPFRGNYAGIGKIWDEDKQLFYSPQPYPSWTLNESTAIWDPPTPHPNDDKIYVWNEATKAWDEVALP